MTKNIWTDREEDFLKLRRKEGHTFVEIGKALGRSAAACRQYYARLMRYEGKWDHFQRQLRKYL